MGGLPEDAVEDLAVAALLAAELAESGRDVCFGRHPQTGRTTAALREPDGTVRMLPLATVVDPGALAAELARTAGPDRVGPGA